MTTPNRRVVIVTALPSEMSAVRSHLRNVREEVHARGSIYRLGIFDERSVPWDVLLAEIGAGNESAAAEVERAVAHFSPEVAIFIGVAGAIKDLNHGDVVASTKVYQYEAGKDRDDYFEVRPETELPAYALLARARHESGESDWRTRIKGSTVPVGARAPEARVGPIAAGPKVLASTRSAVFSFVRRHYGDAVAVEMEGHGFLLGVRMNAPVQGIVIRGISDCIGDKDPVRDQDWQPIAASHAAAFAFQLLARYGGATAAPPSNAPAQLDVEWLRRQLQEAIASAEIPQGVVDALLPRLGDGGTSTTQSGTAAQELVARGREQAWERRARRSLDAEGQRLWEEIRSLIRGLNNFRAIEAGSELRRWLSGEGADASPYIRGRVCVLLADLAVIESAVRSLEEHIDVTVARDWHGRAVTEFGTTVSPEDAARLVYVQARLAWLEGQQDDALSMLDAVNDPSCRSLKLAIFLSLGRDAEAVDIARSLPLDDRWCDRIVLAYGLAGVEADAAPVVAWSQGRPDPTVLHRCIVAWAQGTLQRLLKDRDRRELFFAPLPQECARAMHALLQSLSPLLLSATARGRPSNGVEAEAVEMAFVMQRLLGDTAEWRRLAALLGTTTPVSVEFARAACRRDIDPQAELAERLRGDYPRSFTAGHLAAVLDIMRGATYAQTATAAAGLVTLATDRSDREQIVALLFERAMQDEGIAAIEDARARAALLLPNGHALLRAMAYESLWRSNRLEEADIMLEQWRDENDPVWLQLASARARQRGDRSQAATHMLRAARLLGTRETLWRAFSLADEARDTAGMRETMLALARLTPDDVRVHHNLAAIEFQAGHFREAEAALRQVERISPGSAETGMFRARALALSGRPEEAVDVLNRVCATHVSCLPAFALRAVVLDSEGQPALAFEGLQGARERFWGEMSFVQLYHMLAYRANREAQGHLALLRMQELQRGADDGPLRSGTLDDLRAMVRQRREQHEQLNEHLLVGRLPWLLVGHALRRESYADWAMRTQELSFVPDSPLARAEYAIYATNGLTVQESAEGRSLALIVAPPAGQSVVANLSALMTLHRLGLLEQCLEYHGRVIIPARYMATFLEERRSLQPHQPSELEARRAILTAVDMGRLRTETGGGRDELPSLEEYHLDDEPTDYHLADAVNLLQQSGRLTAEEVGRIRPMCHRPARESGAFQAAAAGGFEIGLTTLIAVHKAGLLDRFIGGLRLYIDPADVESMRQSLLGGERQLELTQWTRELHAILARDERVESAQPVHAVTGTEGDGGDEEPDERDPALDAILLADQRQLALLVDDRCLQACVLNASRGRAGAAFGSDQLLAALAAAGSISLTAWTDAWLQLTRWRYRFLIPAPEVLLEIAARHADFPPGQELREVARYLHDCFLDPGLFCGLEPTTPPMPLGWRYYQAMLQGLGRFIMRVWHDRRFDERAARALTHWCLTEFLPPPPRNLAYAGYAVACLSAPRFLLMFALAEAPPARDIERSNAALAAMAESLGVSADEYDDIMTMMVEADLRLPEPEEQLEVAATARRLTVATAFRHRQGIGVRAASVLGEIGVLDHPDVVLDDGTLTAIADPQNARRTAMPLGPWVFLRAIAPGERNDAMFTPDLIFHSARAVRTAAMGHLTALSAAGFVTPGTGQIVEALAPEVCRDEGGRAREAARAVDNALGHDLLFLIARFRQARAARWRQETDEALRLLLAPPDGTLENVPFEWFRLPGDEWDRFLCDAGAAPTLTAALDRYDERYGHLPLAASRAVESVVRAWVGAHRPDGAWAEVWNWAADESHPLRMYHACRVFLALPDLVPADRRAEVEAATADVLDGFSSDAAQTTPRGQAWELVHTLARHYVQVLDVESHQADATALAALAWWAATRVAAEITAPALENAEPRNAAEMIRQIRLLGPDRYMQRSALGSFLGRALRPPSACAVATTDFNALWRAALLEARAEASVEDPSEHFRAAIELILLAIGTGFPTRGGFAHPPVLAIDAPLEETSRHWLPPQPHSSEPTEEATPSEPSQGEGLQMVEALRTIVDTPEDSRQLVIVRLRIMIGLGLSGPQELDWLLDNKSWWDRTFAELATDDLETLCGTLVEGARRAEDDFQLGILHQLRLQAMRDDLAAGRRVTAARAVVQASVVCGRLTALDLLVQESTQAEVQDALAALKRRLHEIASILPPAVRARLRPVLARLPDGDAPRTETSAPTAEASPPAPNTANDEGKARDGE